MLTIPLLGRESEALAVSELVDGVRDRGGALVLRGEPGIGKSALLDQAAFRADAAGVRVLRTAGVESEARLPFAGLHQLVAPVLEHADTLPAPHRDAVLAAFGMTDADGGNAFLLGLGVLELLGEAASHAPLLLVVEDAHWLDRASMHALTFVARRLESEPIVLLAAIRDGYEDALTETGLPTLRLSGLDDGAAGALLDRQAPGLPPAVRARLLEEAAGNPLALVELPLRIDDGATLPGWLPLTTRLEQAFAARVSGLPATTRTLLLVAALNDGDAVRETLLAASLVAGEDVTERDLEPAVEAELVDLGVDELRFRHPLVRSAIHQAASLSQRHAAHGALAQVLADDPDRRVWHRAAAAVRRDEELAAELERAAAGAQRRGATAVAVTALERAARFSEDPRHAGSRLLQAADLAFELGRYDVVMRLLDETQPLDLGPLERGRLAWLRQLFGNVHWTGAADVAPFLAIVEGMADEGDVEAALSSLQAVAFRLWWSNPDSETRDRVVATAERLPVDAARPELLVVRALAAPVEQGALVLDALVRLAPQSVEDPRLAMHLGDAAAGAGDYALSMSLTSAGIDGLRAQGRVGVLAQGLVSLAWAGVHLGAWPVAVPAAEEAARLSRETGQPRYAAAAELAIGAIAAMQGDHARAERIAAESEAVLLPMGVKPLVGLCDYVRGLAALGAGRHEEAYTALHRIFDPVAVGHHQYLRTWVLGDLVDAAVHDGRVDDALAALAELEPLGEQTPSPILHANLTWARALLAGDDAEARFADALAAADAAQRPFTSARLQLALGAWLRRRRRVSESRKPLRAARETFDALGAATWSDRARQELRASGETSRRRAPEAWSELSPQELQIAQMASEGLTNREIGQRLYLSHRTVSTHLYRIFPKLGITSRAELLRVLPADTVT